MFEAISRRFFSGAQERQKKPAKGVPLPDELVERIVHRLSFHDQAAAMATCKQFEMAGRAEPLAGLRKAVGVKIAADINSSASKGRDRAIVSRLWREAGPRLTHEKIRLMPKSSEPDLARTQEAIGLLHDITRAVGANPNCLLGISRVETEFLEEVSDWLKKVPTDIGVRPAARLLATAGLLDSKMKLEELAKVYAFAASAIIIADCVGMAYGVNRRLLLPTTAANGAVACLAAVRMVHYAQLAQEERIARRRNYSPAEKILDKLCELRVRQHFLKRVEVRLPIGDSRAAQVQDNIFALDSEIARFGNLLSPQC